MMKSIQDKCAVAGVYGDSEAANLVYLALYALQHRGQEASGIASFTSQPPRMLVEKDFGLVSEVFTAERLARLQGSSAIGHNRYSTYGESIIDNIQPLVFKTALGVIAIAHNGQITNAEKIRTELEARGSIFQSNSDTEVFIHLLLQQTESTMVDKIKAAASLLHGAYSFVLLTHDALYAIRDPFGFRPLVIGQRCGTWVVVSETCALDLIEAQFVREVQPGEIVKITSQGMSSSFQNQKTQSCAFCSFETIYFSRPDSMVFGQSVYDLRHALGRELAHQDLPLSKHGLEDVDFVMPVPDSGVPMAIGYAHALGKPFEMALVRNHYVGRTFIEPESSIRHFGVKLKLNPVKHLLKNKSVIVIDDSLVRGTTSQKILRMLRDAGARKIHLRIASPPITDPCFFGIDTPTKDQLLAAQMSVQAIGQQIGADSLKYLSLDRLRKVLADQQDTAYCYGCFGAGYKELIG